VVTSDARSQKTQELLFKTNWCLKAVRAHCVGGDQNQQIIRQHNIHFKENS
jgi:hypothetical protein